MAETHTPGPWTLEHGVTHHGAGNECDGCEGHGSSSCFTVSGGDDGSESRWLHFAVVHGNCDPKCNEVGKANALLIAASPDLLTACESALSELDPRGTETQDFGEQCRRHDAVVEQLRRAIAAARKGRE